MATATATATCGWCKAKGLDKVKSNGDGRGVEEHNRPNTRQKCEGMSTAPGYTRRPKRN